jgi:hypothetical protein
MDRSNDDIDLEEIYKKHGWRQLALRKRWLRDAIEARQERDLEAYWREW